MIQQVARYLFTNQHPYDNPLDNQRAQTILAFNWFIFGIWAFWMLALVLPTTSDLTESILISTAFLIFNPSVFASLKAGNLRLASLLTMTQLIIIAAVVIYFLPGTNERFILILMLPIAMASVLFQRRGIIVSGIALIAMLFTIEIINIRGGLVLEENPFGDLSQLIIITVITIGIFVLFAGGQREIAETSLEDVDRLKVLIETVTRVDSKTTQEQVLQRTIRFLRDAFRYDFAQFYLMDSENMLSMRLRSGVQEIEELDETEILKLGDANAISEAARLLQPVQVSSEDPPNRTHHLLASIQRGVAVPMIHGERCIGVLDIQSVVDVPMSDEEISLLNILANELAAILELLRHIETMRRDLSEQEVLANRLQTQLASLQTQRQQLMGNVWESYIDRSGNSAIGFDFSNGKLQRAENIPQDLQEALAGGEVQTRIVGNKKTLYVPIHLRGEMLGAMSFRVPADQPITQRQLDLTKTIAVRLGSALESTRLLEQTQAQANRERKANEMANMLITATDIESLLKLAADNFNSTLGAIQTQIYIEPTILPTYQKNNGNGSNGGSSA